MRIPPPERRPSQTLQTEWQGHAITVTVGLYPDTGKPCEVFADAVRGGQMQAAMSDACVLISIALQHGISPEALAKSLGKVPGMVLRDGAMVEVEGPASVVGAILAVVGGA